MSTGAIYILTHDDRYVSLALQSLETLKRSMPDLSAARAATAKSSSSRD